MCTFDETSLGNCSRAGLNTDIQELVLVPVKRMLDHIPGVIRVLGSPIWEEDLQYRLQEIPVQGQRNMNETKVPFLRTVSIFFQCRHIHGSLGLE